MFLTSAQFDRYEETIRRAVQWCRDHQKYLREHQDLQGHYKAPYMWNRVGDNRMCGLYRALIHDRFLQPDGDFRMSPTVKGFVHFPCTGVNQYIYANGWLVVGLQSIGAYDIVQRAMPFILHFQDPTHGGFYAAFNPTTGVMDPRLMDTSSTSSAGFACLATGRIAEARRAGDFLLRVLELQPDFKHLFFSCMKADGTLLTELSGSENQWDADGRKQKCLSGKADGGNELTWLIGKPTKFLSRLYIATGDKRYLDGAIRAFDFFYCLDERAWTNFASCKTMWAGSELYRLTGEKHFAETCVRLMEFYAQSQQPEGHWIHTLWHKSNADQTLGWTSDITHEYVAEMSDVLTDFSDERAP
ncbi:MAG: hypothetical protein V1809_02695 [Planctomycetota bacterium]